MKRPYYAVLCVISALVAALATSGTLSADEMSITPTLTIVNPHPTPDSAYHQRFGAALAELDGDILVGNPNKQVVEDRAGAVYLFDEKCGDLIRTFTNPTPAKDDWFGQAVVTVGNRVLIGAPNDDTAGINSGAAYLFDSETGNLLRTFLPPASTSGVPVRHFGRVAAAEGNKVLIGAPAGAMGGGPYQSGLYLFNADTGELLQTFQNPNPSLSSSRFGISVALKNDKVLVGDDFLSGPGTAYLFDALTGTLLHTFLPPATYQNAQFGVNVIFHGDDVLISSSRHMESDSGDVQFMGVAHLFDAEMGSFLRTFANPDPAQSVGSVFALASYGEYVVIGGVYEPYEEPTFLSAGKVDIFDFETSEVVATLTPSAPSAGDYFGSRILTTGSSIIVSATRDDIGGTDTGAVFRFSEIASLPPVETAHPTILWVASYPDSIKRFDGQSGEFIDDFAVVPEGQRPADLTFGPDGKLYVSVPGNNSVQRFDGDNGSYLGNFVTPGSGGLSGPYGLRFGIDGNLYVSDHWNNTVRRYDGETGTHLGNLSSGGLGRPTWLFVLSDLYVASSITNAIKRFDEETGQFVGDFLTPPTGGLQQPLGFVIQPDGYMYVVSGETHEVKRYDMSTGEFVDNFVSRCSGGLKGPVDLQFAGDYLYVSSSATNEIKRYDGATGAFVDTFVGAESGLARPWGLRIKIEQNNDEGGGITIVPGGNIFPRFCEFVSLRAPYISCFWAYIIVVILVLLIIVIGARVWRARQQASRNF
ncbi:hypothetical protein [Sulfuriflexus mobilis]|uniref:hypothetical protein n=1 Tax=Sulfuriflexus mobilis TaxID=1811807 RepID=UPI0015593E8E|nr:hypothetical protein [Sulfuriflexus mobilis]